jgi:hypothetical protein
MEGTFVKFSSKLYEGTQKFDRIIASISIIYPDYNRLTQTKAKLLFQSVSFLNDFFKLLPLYYWK